MRAIDTNVLVRLIVDEAQSSAAEHFIRDGAWVSTLVLAEATWVLTKIYEWRPAVIANAIEMLLQNHVVTVQDSDAVGQALALFRARPSLRFTDCLILELARKAGHLPLGTFDRRLSQAEGAQRI